MTFNVAYPDYDFTSIDPHAFEPVKYGLQVVETINENILNPATSIDDTIKNDTWNAIDSAISLRTCSIFSYLNDPDNPIFSLGKLWSCNYFFFNKKLRRV
uniref:Repressor of RNA polymerase III transcription MAF1 homolog n=1 Tax=Lygus hesperus TaxID=30085 RepID=A0A0A9XIC3_LYGHE